MVIGIAMYTANTKERTGVAWYVFHILKQIARLCPTGVTIRLYTDRPLMDDFFPLPKCVEVRVLHHPLRYVWTHTRLSYELWRHPVDVLFVPSHVLPLFSRVPMVMVIHDIAAIHLPQTYSWFQRFYTIFSARYALKKAKAIVVPSLSTKKDLEQLGQKNKASIHVIPLGVDTMQHHRVSADIIELNNKQLGINAPYFLFIGRLESKKNVQGILKAYEQFRLLNTIRVQLVLVGKPGFGFDDIKLLIETHKFKTDIIIKDTWTQQSIIQALYSGAYVCIYPSLYEGFGLNVLESLLYGVPVIVSQSGSLSELGDDCVVRVDASDTAMIAQAMTKIITDTSFLNYVKERGPVYAKNFSWEKTGTDTLQILLNVVK